MVSQKYGWKTSITESGVTYLVVLAKIPLYVIFLCCRCQVTIGFHIFTELVFRSSRNILNVCMSWGCARLSLHVEGMVSCVLFRFAVDSSAPRDLVCVGVLALRSSVLIHRLSSTGPRRRACHPLWVHADVSAPFSSSCHTVLVSWRSTAVCGGLQPWLRSWAKEC